MKSVNTVCGAMAALLLMSTALAQEMADKRMKLDLAAQPLSSALNAYAKQFNLRILYSADLTDGQSSVPLKGNFTPRTALQELLSGTSLSYEFVDDRTVEIHGATRRTDASSSEPSSSADLNKTTYLSDMGAIRLAQSDSPVSGPQGSRTEGRGEESRDVPKDANGVPLSKIEQVVVTGTHIRGVTTDIAPVQIYSREDISRTGATTTGQFMKTIPQNFASVDGLSALGAAANADASKNYTAGSSINLRGLGTSATLVLVDGNRMAGGGREASAFDISLIPVSAIERVEVLTDGSSAVYGADAVAGVVNFVLRRDFQGAEGRVNYGDSEHGGGRERGGSVSAGTAWEKGNVVGVYEFFDQEPVLESQRDFVQEFPGGTGRNLLLAQQRRNSLFLSGRQGFGQSAEFTANAYYSDRDFGTTSGNAATISANDGFAELVGATTGVSLPLGGDWRTEFILSASRTENKSTLVATFPTLPSQPPVIITSNTRAKLYTIDWRADGSWFELPGDTARMSAGVEGRREIYDDFSSSSSAGLGLNRDVFGAGIELLAPLVGSRNARAGVRRLDLSLAARLDHYEDFGSSTNPKVSLSWAPAKGWNVRGTFAKSFRAPALAQLTTAQPGYSVLALANPADSNGITNTVMDTSSGNPGLTPERSTSRSFGMEYERQGTSSIYLSGNFFDIDYEDRITNPPVQGSFRTIFSQTAALAPFINLSPSQADLQRIYQTPGLSNPSGIPLGSIEAIFDNRAQNIGSSRTKGFDGTVRYSLPVMQGIVGVSAAATYLLESTLQAAPTTAEVSRVGFLFTPARLRGRATLDWVNGPYTALLAVNYTDGTKNRLVGVPPSDVSSWTTADLHLSYAASRKSSGTLLDGLTVSLNIQNIADRNPPSFTVPTGAGYYGFDPTNASALGRYFRFSVGMKFH